MCDVGIAYCDNRTIKCEKKNYNFIPKKVILLNLLGFKDLGFMNLEF